MRQIIKIVKIIVLDCELCDNEGTESEGESYQAHLDDGTIVFICSFCASNLKKILKLEFEYE